jgi:hypothetical protein
MAKRKNNPCKKYITNEMTEPSNSCYQSLIPDPVPIRSLSDPETVNIQGNCSSAPPITTEILKFRGFEYFISCDGCRID